MSENARTLPGGGIINDRRTEDQKAQTAGFVVATDRFMSGWGQARRASYFAVPYRNDSDQLDIVLDNIRERSEMMRVRIVSKNYRPRLREGDHLSIVELDESKGGFYVKDWFRNQRYARQRQEQA